MSEIEHYEILVRGSGEATDSWPQVLHARLSRSWEYAGAMPVAGAPRPGHIPGARNVFWIETMVSQDNPSLLVNALGQYLQRLQHCSEIHFSGFRRFYDPSLAVQGRLRFCVVGRPLALAYLGS